MDRKYDGPSILSMVFGIIGVWLMCLFIGLTVSMPYLWRSGNRDMIGILVVIFASGTGMLALSGLFWNRRRR